ncbi:MAG TPA: AraC family transcriptional regulator [Burkholderiales bacterium]
MAGTPDHMLETPNLDLLSDVLRRMHLASAVFLRGEFSAPWGFVSADEATLARVLVPGAQRLVLLHVAVEGRFRISLASGESAQASEGDAVVLPYCDVHTVRFPDDAQAVPIVELLPPPPWSELPVVCRSEGGGAPTRLLCGYLSCADLLFSPILQALPRLLHLRPSSPSAAQWRTASVRYTLESAGRPGGEALAARLLEAVLADCLRQHVEQMPPEQTGWLAALRDPVIGRAMVLLHARPEAAWTVEGLARRVAVSRSVLAERFRRLLGVSPMRYLTQWRLQLAADLLRRTQLGMAALAERVGYESEAAFSRAFKRHVGVSPAGWREKRAA